MIRVFGKEDSIVTEVLKPVGGVFSPTVFYTHPTLDIMYSEYGFAYPLGYSGLPLSVILNITSPIPADKLTSAFVTHRFLLVDHDGNVWKLLLVPQDSSGLQLKVSYVNTKGTGWWLTTSENDNDEIDYVTDLVYGFLYTDPSKTAIDKFWYKHMSGKSLNHLSIKSIVERLNRDFPKSNTPPPKANIRTRL